MPDLTAEERAADLVTGRTWDMDVAVSGGSWAFAIAAAIRSAEAAAFRRGAEGQREACAREAATHRAVDKYREQYGWPHAQREIAALIRAMPLVTEGEDNADG